jgi:hypothetical protein
MLSWVKQKWFLFALLALWLIFECEISWMATCEAVNDNTAANYDYIKHCTAFGGPVVSILYFILVQTGLFLKSYEHELIAGFTVILAISTIGLWLSTKHLWTTTKAAVELANREFVSTHRPRMRLKHAWFMDQTAWRLNGPLEINLDFVNIGNSPAHIEWINYQSLILPTGHRLPQRPPYDEDVPIGATRISRFRTLADLPSGITIPRQVCDGILDAQEVHNILWGTHQLYLIGTIEYWDYAGLRQTAFCRRLTRFGALQDNKRPRLRIRRLAPRCPVGASGH